MRSGLFETVSNEGVDLFFLVNMIDKMFKVKLHVDAIGPSVWWATGGRRP